MEQDILQKKAERTKYDLFVALQSKNSLQHYLRITYDLIQMPITLCDTSFGVLAAAPAAVVSDTENVETVNGKQYVKFDVTLEMDQKRHTTRILETHRPYVCRDPKFPYEIVFQPVRINRAVVAYLFCPGRAEGFRPIDIEIIEFLGQVLSIELQKNEGFEVESGLKYEYFLQELIDGHFSSDEFAERRLQQLKRKPQPYYYMLHFSFDDPESKRAASNYYYEQLLNILPEGMVSVIRGRLCMLLPRSEPKALKERELQALEKFLDFNRMRCGISYYYTSLVTSCYAIEQAEACSKNMFGPERIYYYEQEYLHHLFSQTKGHGQLLAQIYPDIRLIMKHDQTYRTDLLQTLRAYIFCSRNASAASEQLHIHKSTFFYRMNKIAELLGVDIYDGKRLFAYEFTFYLIDYLKNKNFGGEEGQM